MRYFLCVAMFVVSSVAAVRAEGPLRVAAFRVDVSPPLGSPVAYALTRKIEDPLSARGIVLLGAGEPIVLCAVDSIGIGNDGYDQWREGLANAVGTKPSRVAVHVLHQHDGPRHDFTVEAFLERNGLGGKRFDVGYMRDCIRKVSQAAGDASKQAKPCTKIEVGQAKIDKVASNRRILGPDNKVKIVRYSATTNPAAIEAPEGTIDPYVRLVSFHANDGPVAILTYYACHPQSYYGRGDVTAEFIGLARAQREKDLGDVPHIHFNGAGGNVAAGKYNNGSPALRPILAERVAAGMKAAWDAKQTVKATDVAWRERLVHLPVASHMNADNAAKKLADPKANATDRFNAAGQLAFLQRSKKEGYPVLLTSLRLGTIDLLHMPGELFVEYQLAAQAMHPDRFVCMAAYGDYSPFYIGTAVAYQEGGYETSPISTHVAPAVERVLMEGVRDLLAPTSPE